MPTDGTDVKVYTVGAEYAHAEARKSPGLDGKVERDEFGKEVRYPVILRADEKLIAMKICLAFKVNKYINNKKIFFSFSANCMWI